MRAPLVSPQGYPMTFDQAVAAAAGILVTGIGGWGIKTLSDVVRLVAVLQQRQEDHAKRLDAHAEKHDGHEDDLSQLAVRLAVVETRGCAVKGACLPRPG